MEPLAMAAICDDIRLEITGKPLIIGLYPQVMSFVELPAALAQIYVIVTVFSDIKNPILKFSVEITGPGINLSHEHDAGPLMPSPFPNPTRVEISVTIPIRPFVVTEPGILGVTVRHAAGELMARRLLLQVAGQPIQT
jgi:hypothetical protein